MHPPEPPRVFISYARKDGAELAQRLQSDLMNEGFDAWLDTHRITGGDVWSTSIEREIDTRQVTIALLSPGSYSSDICRAEQLRALDKGNRVIPVLAVEGADRPLYLYTQQYRDFTNDANYDASLGELLEDIRSIITATLPDSIRTTRVTYLTVPPRVANYLHRPEAVHALRDALFADDHRAPIAVTALAGMGGIGKTVLAKALADDEIVQRAFPDGIVWITAGRERKRIFAEEMREVAKALGDDLSSYDTELACENQCRTAIANKAALIVVDDVWSKSDIEPLLAESPRSRFLFTTRDASIGRFVGAREHRAELLDDTQSRELLASWAKVPVAELPAAADEVIDECGRLPLAIAVIGAMLCGAHARFWEDTLDLLRRADLSAIEEQLPPGQESFFKAVEVSFQQLRPEPQERYKRLAVLLEDMPAPLPTLQTLWNMSEAEARRTGRLLGDRSLAHWDGASESIRLHDLQLDYVRAQYSHREVLGLIHEAVRLSAHVIARDPQQFASQIVGRLLADEELPAIHDFISQIAASAPSPWLRPIIPALVPPGTALLHTFESHNNSVVDVAVTPDGQRAVSASADHTLRVWEVDTGRIIHTLKGHSAAVACVAVTPDGQRAVSASADGTLNVWDLDIGRILHTLKRHKAAINRVAVTPNGQWAVSASADHTLRLWDLNTGRVLRKFRAHGDSVTDAAVTPDGRFIISASKDHTLRVWDLNTGRLLRVLRHSAAVSSVAVAPDGLQVLSASEGHTVKVWDLNAGRLIRTRKGNTSDIYGVTLMPDGNQLVFSSAEKAVRVWDLDSGRDVRTLQGHSADVCAIAVTPDGKRVISASKDRTLKVWDLDRRRPWLNLGRHSAGVNAVVVTPDGGRGISASADHTLKVWDLETGLLLRTLEGHAADVSSVAITPDGKCAVSASWDPGLKVWDLEFGILLRTLDSHEYVVHGVAVTPDGKRVVSASGDHTLTIWDLGTGRVLRTLEGHNRAVCAVAVTPDGRRAVSASNDRTLKVWDLDTGAVLHTLKGHSGEVYGVAVTANGKRAVSASEDHTLKVWNLDTGVALRSLEGHSDSVNGVSVAPFSGRVVSASCRQDSEGVGFGQRTADCHIRLRRACQFHRVHGFQPGLRRRHSRPRVHPVTRERQRAVEPRNAALVSAGPPRVMTRHDPLLVTI